MNRRSFTIGSRINAQEMLYADPLTLTADQCDEVNDAVFNSYFNDTGQGFNNVTQVGNFSDLPWQAQTVISDLSYNLGNLSVEAPTFWGQVTSGDWEGAYQNLTTQFGSPGSPVANRAQTDAGYLRQAINAGTLAVKQ